MPSTTDLAQRLAALGFEESPAAGVERRVETLGEGRSRIEHRTPAMGTLVSVSAVSSVARGDEAIGRALDEMGRLIAIFSHFSGSSAASELNAAGRLAAPPPELVQVMSEAGDWHRVTDGTFDISVAPLVELFRSCPAGRLPDSGEIREALEVVGAGRIEVSKRQVVMQRDGMRVTLDGIAKGFIVDAMAQHLESHGITDYLVEAGGDIRVKGSNGRGQPWRIAVQDPDRGERFPDEVLLSEGAVATSGSYEKSFDASEEHHHIFNAVDGKSPRFARSVTVVAPTALAADALATSVFLMQPEAGARFVDRLSGCDCLAIGRDGTQTRSAGWRSAFRQRGEAV